MSKDQVITMFYELKDANTGEILESNMQEGGQISFITGPYYRKAWRRSKQIKIRWKSNYKRKGSRGLWWI